MKGFTIIETIVSISIIALLAGISIPAYSVMKTKNEINIATITVTQTLRQAQSLAQSGKGDSSWGIKAGDGQVTLFKGADYSTRDTAADKIFDLSPKITFSGLTEVVFSKYHGLPSVAGVVSVSNGDETKDIIINDKGMVDY